jgi:hypothetical protein
MARAGNAGDTSASNSLCTSPDACGGYSNTKTCRGDLYTYPDDNADAAYTDSRSTDGNADAAYADPCPTDGNADAAYADLCPIDGNADAAYADPCPTDGYADAAYADPCPTDGYASPTFPNASTNRYTTGHTNRHTAAANSSTTNSNAIWRGHRL